MPTPEMKPSQQPQTPPVQPTQTVQPPQPPQPPVSAAGVIKCPACGKDIFETSSRVELNGRILQITIDSGTKQKKINALFNSTAFCSTKCLVDALNG